MRQTAHKQQIRQCRFMLQATQGTASIKFSCLFFIEVKTGNSKHVISSRNRCKLVEGKLTFNQQLQLVTNMIYDCKNQRYVKKQAIITVNLISNSRPNESKLVGRVVVDIGKVANKIQYQQAKTYPLQYCSVNGALTFKFVLKEAISTNKLISDLERSQLSQFQSISINTTTKTDNIKPQKADMNVILLNRINLNEENTKNNEESFQKQLKRIKTEVALIKKSELTENSKELPVKYQTDNFVKENKKQKYNQQNIIGEKTVKSKVHENSYILIRDTHEIDSNRCGSQEKTKSEIQHNKLYESVIQGNGTLTRDLVSSPQQHFGPSSPLPNNEISNLKRQERQLSTRRVTLLLQENRQQKSKLQQYERDLSKKQQQIQKLNITVNNKNEQLIRMSTSLQQQIEQLNLSLNIKKEQLRKIQTSSNMKEQDEIIRLNTALQAKDEELKRISTLMKEQKQMEKLDLAINSLSEQLNNMKKQISEKQTQIEQYVEQIQKLQHFQVEVLEIIDIKQQNQNLIQQNQFIKKELEEKVTRIFQLEQTIQDYKMENQQTSKRQIAQRDEIFNNIKGELDSALEQLSTQIKNHQATNIQLKQVRQWYNGMQEETNKLQVENSNLKHELEMQQTKESDYQLIIEQLQERLNIQTQRQADYMKRQQEYRDKQEEIVQLQNELTLRKEEIACYIQKQCKEKNNETKKIVQLRKENDELQLKFQNQNDQLKLEHQKVQQLQRCIRELEKKLTEYTIVIRKKEDEIHTIQQKNTDLIRRFKDKEETITKLGRTMEETQFKARQLQFSIEQYKKRLKTLEDQKYEAIKQTRTAQRQSRQLKYKIQRDFDSMNRQILAYKSLIHTIQNERNHLTNQLDNKHRKQSFEEDNRKDILENMIKKKTETKKIIHENLNVLEYQSNRIADILRKKEQYELQLTQAISVLYSENDTLKKDMSRLQDQCRMYRQRSEGLTTEIELLNSYTISMNGGELPQFSRKLMEGNRDMLRVIEEKSNEIIERTKSENQLIHLVEQYQLSHSVFEKDKLEMEGRLRETNEIKNRLQQQLTSLKTKFQEEVTANKVINQKIQQLQSEIMSLSQKHKQQTQRQKKEIQQEINHNNLLNQQISKLKSQFKQKELEIQQYITKKKQLENHINELSSQIKPFSQNKEMRKYIIYNIFDTDTVTEEQHKLHIRNLQTKLEQLQQNYNQQQKQLINLHKQLSQLHQTSEEELNHINYLQSQLKSCRERQSDYITCIDQLEERWIKSREFITHQTTNDSMDSIQKHEFKKHYQRSIVSSETTINKRQTETGKTHTELSNFKNQLKQHRDITCSTVNTKEVSMHFPCELNQTNMQYVVNQLTGLVYQRKQEEQVQKALRLLIESNAKQDEEYEKWNRDRGCIQEKAKLASRELQKMKVNIMKIPGRNISQKTQITGLLKPIQNIVNQLIHLSENLAEMDLLQEQYEYYQQTYTKERV